MSDSPHLKLTYLEGAQAQKHVTVNDALRALDALVKLSVKDRDLTAPPGSPVDGDRYIPAATATGTWTGKEGQIAAYQDGAWAFYPPEVGWEVYLDDERQCVRWHAGVWEPFIVKGSFGARTYFGLIEEEHTLALAATSTPGIQIPDRAIVLGVTALVSVAVTGATSFSVGVAADATRYGNSIGIAKNSANNGISGSPTGYFAATPLLITAAGGNFSAGKLRLAIHYMALDIPDFVP